MIQPKLLPMCVSALLVGVLGCSLVGVREVVETARNAECIEGAQPLISLDVTIDPQHSKELAAQLKEFAASHEYGFRLTAFTPDGEDFSVEMHRPGVHLVADMPFNPGEFFISFYNWDCAHPTTADDLRDEVTDLISLLKEIPGIEIVEDTEP